MGEEQKKALMEEFLSSTIDPLKEKKIDKKFEDIGYAFMAISTASVKVEDMGGGVVFWESHTSKSNDMLNMLTGMAYLLKHGEELLPGFGEQAFNLWSSLMEHEGKEILPATSSLKKDRDHKEFPKVEMREDGRVEIYPWFLKELEKKLKK